jgi:hypothetical protein
MSPVIGSIPDIVVREPVNRCRHRRGPAATIQMVAKKIVTLADKPSSVQRRFERSEHY